MLQELKLHSLPETLYFHYIILYLFFMQPIELTDNQASSEQATSGEHALPEISQGMPCFTKSLSSRWVKSFAVVDSIQSCIVPGQKFCKGEGGELGVFKKEGAQLRQGEHWKTMFKN